MPKHHASPSGKRLTAAQIATRPFPEPAIAVRLYQPTNELAFASPVRGASGRYGDEVYHWRGDKCFVRRYATPLPPGTPRQLDHQERMRIVMPSWSLLPAEVRRAWLDYSLRHFGEFQLGKKRGNLGQNLYTQAQLNRLAWGEELSALPPSAPPPRRAIQIVEVPAPNEQIAWKVIHGLKPVEGYRLEVRMTPGTVNKPLERHLVRAGATTSGSFFPLKTSGTVYLLEQPLHSPAAGERYGLRMKLITPEGVEGPALTLDLTRRQPGELPPDSPANGSDDPLQLLERRLAPNGVSAFEPPGISKAARQENEIPGTPIEFLGKAPPRQEQAIRTQTQRSVCHPCSREVS